MLARSHHDKTSKLHACWTYYVLKSVVPVSKLLGVRKRDLDSLPAPRLGEREFQFVHKHILETRPNRSFSYDPILSKNLLLVRQVEFGIQGMI